MTAHPLDRPVWSMLTGRQAHLAAGDARALRLDRGYGVFGVAADTGAAAQEALAALIPPGEDLWLVEGDPWPLPPGTREVKRAALTQMVAKGPPPEPRRWPPTPSPVHGGRRRTCTGRSTAFAKRAVCSRWPGNAC